MCTAKSFFVLCPEEVVDAILKWRDSVAVAPARPGPKRRRTNVVTSGEHKLSRTSSFSALRSRDLGVDEEGTGLKSFKAELTRLAFDYITAAFLSFVFEDQAEDVVSKKTLEKIIDICFSVMKRVPTKVAGESAQQCYLSNFTRTSDLYGYLASVLHTESSMAIVCARYIRELQAVQSVAGSSGSGGGSSSGSSGSGGGGEGTASGSGSVNSDTCSSSTFANATPSTGSKEGDGTCNGGSSNSTAASSGNGSRGASEISGTESSGGNSGNSGNSGSAAASSSGSGAGSSSGDPYIVLSLLNGIRFVRLRLAYKCTCEFLRQYFEFFKCREKDFQRDVFSTYLDIFSKLVHRLVSDATGGQEAPDELKALAQTIWVWTKKNLRPSQNNSLLTLLLCLCDKDFFYANWWAGFAEPLYREKKTRALGLDAIPILAEHYATLRAGERNIAVEHIRVVAVRLFPASKKTILQNPEDPLDRQVDFVCCMTNALPEFVIDNILLPNLLRVPEPGTPLEHFVPDRLVVGLRSLYVIHRATVEPLLAAVAESSELALPPRSFYGSNEYSFGIVRANKASLLTSRYPALVQAFAKVVEFIISCGTPAKAYDYYVLFHEAEKAMLALVPFLFEGSHPEQLLKFIVSRLDSGCAEKVEKDNAFMSMYFLFVFRPAIREQIITLFTKYFLDLPHTLDSAPLATTALSIVKLFF